VAGATYTWTVGNGTLQSGQGTASITLHRHQRHAGVAQRGGHAQRLFIKWDRQYRCRTVRPTITSSGPTSFCPGGSVTLTSSSGASFQWLLNARRSAAHGASFIASAVGNYSVTVTRERDAPAPRRRRPSPDHSPVTGHHPLRSTTFCTGGSVTLTASAAVTFQWLRNGVVINGATSQTFGAAISGSYTVTSPTAGMHGNLARSERHCESHSGRRHHRPGRGLRGRKRHARRRPRLRSYAWSTGATTQTITVSPSSTTTYSVTVTSNGCTASTSTSVAVTSGSSTSVLSLPRPERLGPATWPRCRQVRRARPTPGRSPAHYDSGGRQPRRSLDAGNSSFRRISVNVTTALHPPQRHINHGRRRAAPARRRSPRAGATQRRQLRPLGTGKASARWC